MAEKRVQAEASSSRMRDDGAAADAAAALRGALGELRDEIKARFPAERTETAAVPDLEALFQALRRRLGTLGMVERSAAVDEFGMDDVALRRAAPLVDFLFDRFWRVDLLGHERLPAEGPCLLVANRSGVLPYDGLMLAHGLAREHPRGKRPRFLVADGFMGLPFAHSTLAQLGGVRACRENAERLLASGHFVVAFPEGGQGAAKPFAERYQLQRFGRGGVVRLALASGAPLFPVGIVGAEEAHPLLTKVDLPVRRVGLPFLPVTPTFPLLGPLGLLPLPTKWVIRIGEAVAWGDLGPDAARDDLVVARLNEELRTRVQALVNAGLADRESVWRSRERGRRLLPL